MSRISKSAPRAHARTASAASTASSRSWTIKRCALATLAMALMLPAQAAARLSLVDLTTRPHPRHAALHWARPAVSDPLLPDEVMPFTTTVVAVATETVVFTAYVTHTEIAEFEYDSSAEPLLPEPAPTAVPS
ncbi:hypothetical protein CXG81DRAFT_28496 [Caulochytrium protostelioides]|uniref:Uncharacterized protein n=1 Tax=Caulochytrium protostelioides TaxID=1555241 RepID=A0A4P9X2G1_9FUNG|nr:hypothetical protein CXG81DRAFT_28496 [Caulochytrium protostelioides]|eukprot:RKO98690.1 hypothetical protein CXG81DRAFT_28496 [Caulochytrium protostelioides]